MVKPGFDPNELVGRLLFDERRKTFLKILAVIKKEEGLLGGYYVKVVKINQRYGAATLPLGTLNKEKVGTKIAFTRIPENEEFPG